MGSVADQPGVEDRVEPRGVSRRQVIAGTGVAAAAWIAPTIVHIDVASAQGSGSSTLTVTPGNLPMGVSVNPVTPPTMLNGEPIFGEFGRANDPNDIYGDRLIVTFTNPPTHTQVTVTARICYQTTWEASNDTMDVQVDGVSGTGFPTTMVGASSCITYPSFTVPHTGTLTVTIIGDPAALVEDFGIASLVVEFS